MKGRICPNNTDTMASDIAVLATETRTELISRWRALYRSEPPRRISRDLLTRALAYRIQEQALGGLKPSTRRLLARVAADASAHRPIETTPASSPVPGTVLLRQWQGKEHRVIVRERGVEYRGRLYKSLSEIARRITGSKWSGPLFFGLKQRATEKANG